MTQHIGKWVPVHLKYHPESYENPSFPRCMFIVFLSMGLATINFGRKCKNKIKITAVFVIKKQWNKPERVVSFKNK